ncbi:MAG: tyrosine-type recombinase/integrase [Spirochaetaceae bacterium]|nr:tyrosine-type recombinase/integrase [Spirochaetaceae bacterium]
MDTVVSQTFIAESKGTGITAVDRAQVVAALASATSPNTRRAYRSGWERWQAWALKRSARVMPADPSAVAAYLTGRSRQGCAPATVRVDRAAISAAHRAIGSADPTASAVVHEVMRSIAKAGRDRGRGQVQGLDWDAADRIATLAENGGRTLIGLRDGALIRVGSDALLRVTELSELDVADVQLEEDGIGTVTVRHSKTDQEGRGHVRYLGAPTIAAVQNYLSAAGVADGPLFRRLDRGVVGGRLGAGSIRRIIAHRAKRAGIDGRVSGQSLRVGAAQSLAAKGAGLVELQEAGDWKSPNMPSYYARNQLAARGAVARLRYGVGKQ